MCDCSNYLLDFDWVDLLSILCSSRSEWSRIAISIGEWGTTEEPLRVQHDEPGMPERPTAQGSRATGSGRVKRLCRCNLSDSEENEVCQWVVNRYDLMTLVAGQVKNLRRVWMRALSRKSAGEQVTSRLDLHCSAGSAGPIGSPLWLHEMLWPRVGRRSERRRGCRPGGCPSEESRTHWGPPIKRRRLWQLSACSHLCIYYTLHASYLTCNRTTQRSDTVSM